MSDSRLAALVLALALPVCGPAPAAAGERVAGPVEARVVRVIDGDSFVAEAHVWPGHRITVTVRLRGIDAPELRARCAAERRAAERARAALAGLIGDGPVRLRAIGGGKYFGRVVADVTTADGNDVAQHLLARALAAAYDGGRRRAVVC